MDRQIMIACKNTKQFIGSLKKFVPDLNIREIKKIFKTEFNDLTKIFDIFG